MPNYQDAEDILQNVNFRLWERRATYRANSNFAAWACTLARYEVLSYRNQLKRQRRLVFGDDLIEALTETANSSEREVDGLREKRQILRQCLQNLRPSETELLLVRYTKGLSLVKHAEKLETSAESLRVTLYRARKALKSCVASKLQLQGRAGS